MLVRNPSTGMSNQRVHVYMALHCPRDPLCSLCQADQTLPVDKAVRTPTHQSQKLWVALAQTCRGTKPAGQRRPVNVGGDVRRIETIRDPTESEDSSVHLRSPPRHPPTRATCTVYTIHPREASRRRG